MPGKIRDWVEDRFPVKSLLDLALDEEIPGGARTANTLGSALLLAFTIQAVTGILQLFYYVPSTDHAYDSIGYLVTTVPFGWLIHGVHHWGANLMVVLVLLHVTRVFLWGSYKKPRELTWLAGVALLLLVMGFVFTGGPLLWDQHGYWAGEVGTSISGTVPFAGELGKAFLRGGEQMGQLALSRLFALHVGLLPVTLALLAGIHITAMRKKGHTGPLSGESAPGPFWPDQAFRDAAAGLVVLLLAVAGAALLPPAWTGPADPLDTTYVPKPDWPFLFLYESLKFFQGKWEPVGTVGVPGVLVTLLLLVPFLDRREERRPWRRPVATGLFLLFAILLGGLTLAGYRSHGFAHAVEGGVAVSPSSAASGATGPGPAAASIGSVESGKAIFARSCAGCHGAEGKGPGSTAPGAPPPLAPIDRELYSRDPREFAERIDVPIQHGIAPSSPGGTAMPAFGDTAALTQPAVANVEAYVLSLNGVDRGEIVNPGVAPKSFLLLLAALCALAGVVTAAGHARTKG
jgi:ubiquinol-cytochrome c reductase cytochrome b subunit